MGGRRRSGSRPEKTDRSAATLSRTDGGLLIFSAAESRGKEVREWRIEGSIVAPSYFGERGGKEGPDWVWEGEPCIRENRKKSLRNKKATRRRGGEETRSI